MGQTCSYPCTGPDFGPCTACSLQVRCSACSSTETSDGEFGLQADVGNVHSAKDGRRSINKSQSIDFMLEDEQSADYAKLGAAVDQNSDSWKQPLLPIPKKRHEAMLRRRSSFAVGNADKEYQTRFPTLLEVPAWSTVFFLLVLATALVLASTTYKDLLQSYNLSREALWKYASLPIVSVLFTYVHIWLALWLTFYPINYHGCLQIPDTNTGCGWQGIMPNKAGKMARMSVALMTEHLIKVHDIVARIDSAEVASLLEPVLRHTLFDMIQEVAMKAEPDMWRRLPDSVKKQLVSRANGDAPAVIDALVSDLRTNIDSVFDLSEMVENAFTREPALLNHMFISCGYSELRFIRNCGAYMGGVAGLIQMGMWIYYPAGWMLPAFGFFAGIFSNWIALKMIFEPVEPRYICGMKIQGLFLQRQEQVSEVYAQIVADNVLFAKNIIIAIVTGRCCDELLQVLHKHMGVAMDNYLGMSRPLVKLFRTEQHIKRMKRDIAEAVMERLPPTVKHVEKYIDTAMGLEDLLCEKLKGLDPTAFEGLLHPVFQEDEWKLVLMGGVLGIIIGCMQWKCLGA